LYSIANRKTEIILKGRDLFYENRRQLASVHIFRNFRPLTTAWVETCSEL